MGIMGSSGSGCLLSTMLVRTRFSLTITALRAQNALTIRAFGKRSMISSALPLEPVSIDEETKIFQQRCSDMQEFFTRPRFASIKRPYTASDVVSKQGSFPPVPLPGSLLSDKLFALFSRASKKGKPVHTMGAIDPVQVTQMARYQEVVYVSGWAASSTLTTANNEVGPDLS
jgi:isocitrate lyase